MTTIIGALLLAQPAAIEPVSFGQAPIEAKLALGRAWGRQRAGAVRAAAAVQRPVGSWFDGRIKRPIEFAWWYSPGYVSSRLGYLAAEEYWQPFELDRRWAAISDVMAGRLVFLVQLAAAPKIDFLTGDDEQRADLDQIEHVRFVLVAGRQIFSPVAAGVMRIDQSRSAGIFKNYLWYQFAPAGSELLKEFEAPVSECHPLLGDYHIRIYRVEFALSEAQMAIEDAQAMSLRILSRTKERRADYALAGRGSTR